MNIVIVGDGKVGYALTERLLAEGHDIVVIDSNMKVLAESSESLDVMVVNGNGASLSVQREANVQKCDLFIAATSTDEQNILACMLAKKLGADATIARVRNPEYAEQLVFLREELGLSLAINPEQEAAREITRLLQYPSAIKLDSFAKGRVEIVEMLISETCPMAGKKLSDLMKIAKQQVLICAVVRGGMVYIPDGNFMLLPGDKIHVTASTDNLVNLARLFGMPMPKIKSVMIVGGSRISFYLAHSLISAGMNVKIIEIDEKKCATLSEKLPQAVIIHADGSQREVLVSEGIKNMDGFVSLTNIDEENLIISLYAIHVGVPKVVTKVNRLEYMDVFQDIRLDSVVVPKMLTANNIVRYVRALQNTVGSSVIALHRIVNDMAEAVEFRATLATKYLGVKLTDLRLKKGLLIACIIRGGKVILPRGDSCIMNGDNVIVVTTNQIFNDLNDIFED